MFSTQNIYFTVLAVVLSMSFIAGAIYFVNKLFANDTQEILVKFIVLVFTSMVGVYIIDKIVAFKIQILSKEQDDDLFELIKTLVLMIFSYYFGIKKNK